jgi:hypothetical protein
MYVQFEVDGVPPKKDGANSMWRKSSEIPRLKALRQAAFTSLQGQSIKDQKLELVLRVHAVPGAGDLDNFITGICDGLMSAHPRTPINDHEWSDVSTELHPRRAVAFTDDSCVSRIVAERLPTEDSPRYEVELRGMNGAND